MTTTPRLGATQLASGQALPETAVNDLARFIEQGASRFVLKDRDPSTTPPGSPADGDAYLVPTSATGAWSGQAGKIAFYLSTGWQFITAKEGFRCYVMDEDIEIVFDGSAWNTANATAAQIWAMAASAFFISPGGLLAAAAPTALTSSANITPDGNAGFNFSLTLAHAATLKNPSNFKVGQSGVIAITQDATGTRTLAYESNWKFPGGAPVLSTAAGSIDVISYYVSASGVILCNLTKAYSS